MRLTDTHAHLYHHRFDDDREAALDRAREAGVRAFLLPAIDVPSIHAALEMAVRHDDVWAMAAIHPSDTKEATDADFAEVARLALEDRIVAIGETGLDYYWDRSFDERQHDFLRRHIELAEDLDLPLVFHNRDAHDALITVVEDVRASSSTPERIRGVFHCFGGTAAFAERVLRAGFHVGIGGSLTFKNSDVRTAIADVPLERIVLETDAPFLAPVPYRGKRNESAWIVHVAEFLAELRGMTARDVADATTRNAERVFGVKIPD